MGTPAWRTFNTLTEGSSRAMAMLAARIARGWMPEDDAIEPS
jgi:hypothetical protein